MPAVFQTSLPLHIALPIAVFLVSWTVGYLLLRFVWGRLHEMAKHSAGKWDDVVVSYARVPLYFVNVVVASGIALSFAPDSVRTHPAAKMAPTIVVILLVAWILSRAATGAIENMSMLNELGSGAKRFLIGLIRASFLAIGLLIILDTLGISITPLLASLGVGSIAVALALQDTLSNFFSGIYMLIDRPIREGDFIRVDGTAIEGTVRKIGWRSTRIELPSNNEAVIPNTKLSSSVLMNFDYPLPEMGFSVPVGVAYDSDLDKVESIAIEVATKIQRTVEGGVRLFTPSVRFTAFGDSAITFNINLRTEKFSDQFLLRHELIKALKRRFEAEKIEMPFPQRVVHMKTPIG